jgi:serine/alanine adding enzyme
MHNRKPMELQIQEIRKIPDEYPYQEWNILLEQIPAWSFFQTPTWSQIVTETLIDSKPCHHWIRYSDGLEAILPGISIAKRFGFRKIESLPWGTYGDLISIQPVTNKHRLLLSKILRLNTPLCDLTIPVSNYNTIPMQNDELANLSMKHRYTHILELQPSFEEVWNEKFQSRNKTSIKRIRKNTLKITRSSDRQHVEQFKNLYQQAKKQWEGIETIPDRFFESLNHHLCDSIQIWSAHNENTLVSAMIMLFGKNEIQYFAGATHPEYRKLGGSKLILTELIKYGCENGYRYCNFGASGGEKGVEQFKEIFGGEKSEYCQIRIKHKLLSMLGF